MKKEYIELGSFEVVSKVLRISDPCYNKNTWCAGTVKNALPGTWEAIVQKIDMEDSWGNRCRKLLAAHTSFNAAIHKFRKLKFTVGVDSGQAGIFDDKFYKKDYKEDYLQLGRVESDYESYLYNRKSDLVLFEAKLFLAKTQKEIEFAKLWLEGLKQPVRPIDYSIALPTKDWYEICCDTTSRYAHAGVINNGVVSRSGDGDGSYMAFAAYDDLNNVVAVCIKF